MSLSGEINKVSGHVRRAMESVASRNFAGTDGIVRGTKKILGYVCAINEEGDLAGTVDVQEFEYEPGEYTTPGMGHHEGVRLSAIQNNADGFLIVPMMFSEVVIVQNPHDGQEYVVMYSHAKRIQLSARSLKGASDGEVRLGVSEVEDFNETDNGLEADYDELEPTGNSTQTVYRADSITDKIISPDDELTEERTAAHKTLTVGDTKIEVNGDSVSITTSGKISMTIGSTTITEEDGKVSIKTQNAQIEGDNITVKGSNVTITGGTLKTQGAAAPDMNGPYNAIKACPFSGAPHCGSTVSGT